MTIQIDNVTNEIDVVDAAANASITLMPKGTGAVNFAPGSSGLNLSNGNTVTAITRTAGGTTYTSKPSITVSAPTTAGGVQATASVALMNSNIATVQAGGTGYTVGDVLTVVGGTPTSSSTQFTVATVSGGVVTSVGTPTGTNYSVLPTNPVSTTGGTGTGCTLNLSWGVASGGITVDTAGSGYVEQPTVTFSGGGGSGAAAYATVGSNTVIRSIGAVSTQAIDFAGPSSTAIPILSLRDIASSDSFVRIQNGSTGTGFPLIYAAGNANSTLTVLSNGTGALNLGTNGTSQTRQMAITHTSSAVNYVQVTGASTGNAVNISAQGSDSNVRLVLRSKAAEGIQFEAGNNARQVFITAVNNAVNYLTLSGSIANNAVPITVAGTDTNIDLNLTTKGTGALNVIANGATQFKIGETAITNAVNYVSIFGGATGVAPRLLVRGSDTNINLLYSTKGSGEHVFRTNETNNDQFRITHTASAVNYVQVTGAATGVFPTISAQGSDTNISLNINGKGTGYVNIGSNQANYWQLYGSASTAGNVTMYAWGSDANLNVRFESKGTGGIHLRTGNGGLQFVVADTASAVNYIQATGAATTANPVISAQGSDSNIGLNIASKGTSGVTIFTGTRTSMVFADVTNAVNYWQANSSATGGTNILFSNGSDTNINAAIASKNTGAVELRTNATSGSIIQFRVSHTASAANYLNATGAAAGASPVLSSVGSDTNIDLSLQPKGTGYVQFGTHTATALTISGYIEIKDSAGNVRKLAVVT